MLFNKTSTETSLAPTKQTDCKPNVTPQYMWYILQQDIFRENKIQIQNSIRNILQSTYNIALTYSTWISLKYFNTWNTRTACKIITFVKKSFALANIWLVNGLRNKLLYCWWSSFGFLQHVVAGFPTFCRKELPTFLGLLDLDLVDTEAVVKKEACHYFQISFTK